MDTLTISTNFWRVPSVETALSGCIEGTPTEEERANLIGAAEAARQSWKPNAEAMQLAEELKQFIGCRVRLQFWDPIMYLLEQEGPFPVAINCTGIILLQAGEFLQAYMQVTDPEELRTPDGYSAMGYLHPRDGGEYLAPIADVYTVSTLSVDCTP